MKRDDVMAWFQDSKHQRSEGMSLCAITRELLRLIELKARTQPHGQLFGRILPNEHLIQVLGLEPEWKGYALERIGYWQGSGTALPINNGEPPVRLVISGQAAGSVGSGSMVQCLFQGKPVTAIRVYDSGEYDARTRGLTLATGVRTKKALVIGAGSVGSRQVTEYVRHGVNVTVADPQTIDPVNPYRWVGQLPLERLVGRRKVEALKEMLEESIPGASLRALPMDFCKEIAFFDELIGREQFDLMVVTTDTEDSRREANAMALRHELPTLFVALSDRAESGQVQFVSGRPEDPCYLCLAGAETTLEWPTDVRPRQAAYGAEHADHRTGAAALSVDVSIVSYLAAKLALAVLAGEELSSYFSDAATGGTVFWFSTVPNAWILEHFAQKLVAKVEKNPDCPACSGARILRR